jgi:hypothetical protein
MPGRAGACLGAVCNTAGYPAALDPVPDRSRSAAWPVPGLRGRAAGFRGMHGEVHRPQRACFQGRCRGSRRRPNVASWPCHDRSADLGARCPAGTAAPAARVSRDAIRLSTAGSPKLRLVWSSPPKTLTEGDRRTEPAASRMATGRRIGFGLVPAGRRRGGCIAPCSGASGAARVWPHRASLCSLGIAQGNRPHSPERFQDRSALLRRLDAAMGCGRSQLREVPSVAGHGWSRLHRWGMPRRRGWHLSIMKCEIGQVRPAMRSPSTFQIAPVTQRRNDAVSQLHVECDQKSPQVGDHDDFPRSDVCRHADLGHSSPLSHQPAMACPRQPIRCAGLPVNDLGRRAVGLVCISGRVPGHRDCARDARGAAGHGGQRYARRGARCAAARRP